jgi:sortase (surface protein transpeptidase)
MLAPVLTLYAADAVAAQGEPPYCDPGYVVDENTQECVPDEGQNGLQPECDPGFIYDENTGECVPDQQEQPACDPGFIYDQYAAECVPEETDPVGVEVQKYDCPPGEDWYSQSYDYLASQCAPNSNPVTLTLNGQDSQSVTNYAEWTDLPAGDYSVSEEVPQGYGDPIIVCGYYVPGQGNPSPDDTHSGNSASWQLDPGYYVHCWWFNIPTQTYNWIDFYKYECAYDAPTDQDTEYYLQNCKAVEGWDFDVSWDGGGTTETTDSSGYASWPQVPTGDWSGSEDLPPGYGQPLAWCRYVEWPQGAQVDSNWFPNDPSSGQLGGTFDDSGYRIECSWFNFAPADDYNWIDFYKYECPTDLDTGGGYEYYVEECSPVKDWDFEVQWDGGGSTETTDADGKASWSGVPQDGWTGSEDLPDGYGDPAVFCRFVEWPDEAGYDNTWVQVEAPGGVYSQEFDYDQLRYECYWFNFPTDDDYNWIDFYKYECTFDAPYDEEYQWYVDNCQPVDGWEWDLSWDGGGGTQQTDGSGKASWSGVPQGDWQAQENLPDGYGQPIVWCRWAESPDEAGYSSDWERSDATDGFYESSFDYDQVRYECYWFNWAPETDYNWIDFYKYWCDYDTPTDESYEYYLQNCEPREGWEFDVSWEGGGSTETTDSEGHASWSGVPQGAWSGSETVPEGYGQPYLWCRYVEWPDSATDIDGDWFQYDLSGGSEINTGFDYDELRFECYWFNFAPDEDYNWIEIYKYYCPEGTSYDMEAASLAEDCTVFGDVSFTLDAGSYSEERTTDQQGYASWNDVPQGNWTLTEAIPDGYGEPVVYCRYVEWPTEATGYDDATFPYQPSGGIFGDSFEGSGYHLVCGIFNIPGDDYNWIDFYKYECAYDAPTDQDADYYQQNCQPVSDWDFDAQWDGGGSTQTTDDSGKASWSGVPTGSWSGSETLPSGYGQPIVFCRYVEWPDEAGYDNSWQRSEAPDGVYSGEFEYDQVRYECYWFNFTTGTNWIDFYKYECPAGAPYDEGFAWYDENCTIYTDGVDYDVSWTGGGSTQTTDQDGYASWSGVPTGGWQAQETIPDGFGDPVVWCQWVEWPDEAGYTDEFVDGVATGGFYDGAFEYSGSRIECHWYNIPYQQSWIDITKYWCSEEILTPYEQASDYLLQNCETYTEGADFTLEYRGGPKSLTTNGSGDAEWSGLPTGRWSLHETVPDGYGEPVVYCSYVEWPDEAGYTDEPAKYDAPGGSFTGEFAYGGVRIHCDIFNIPTYDWGWITVYKWYCAEGVATDSSAEYLRDTCYPVTTGVDFSLDYGTTSHPQTTDSEGKAEWGKVPTGGWTLSETTGSSTYGDPVIYCQWTEWPDEYAGEYNQDLYQPDQEGATITGSHEYPGLRLVCYWFNFGYEGGDNGITIYKYWCEPGSDYGESLQSWQEGCTETSNGTQFTLTSGQTTSPKSTYGGSVQWTDVAEGGFSVQEDLPTGYEQPRLWCYQYNYSPDAPDDPLLELANFEAQSVENGLWEGTFDGSPYRIVCYWFNIPGDDNTVTVYKYTCAYEPVGFNTLGQWQEACPTKGDGVDFTLDYEGASEPKTTTGGKAEWTDVPLGEFTLTEDPYPGYGDPVVWCGWTAYYEGAVYDAFPAIKDATGGVYKGEIAVPGTTYFCYWFNIPEEHSKIVVYKYNCPEGTHTEGTMDFYQEKCTDWGDGIEFTLDNTEGSTTKEIANGTATWNDVPQGEFTLTENLPFGYDQPLWWCGFTGYDGGAIFDGFPQTVEAPEGIFTGSIDYEVTTYYCWVFNFPNYDREVTVYKWYCAEGYQSESQDYQAWKSDCVQKASGVNFNLTHDGGSWSKGTNLGGKATWYGSEPGPHTLTEQYLPGYESPYVFCSLEAFYDDGAAYAEDYQWYDVSDYTVSKDLGDYANYTWICHFFNVPKDNGEITIYKWYCPPGYEVNVWGANPTKDCTQAQNGVAYVLDKPVGSNVPQTTGDSIPGGVFWGDLPQGTYTVTEMVPSDVSYTFIWDCVGTYIPKVHPNPLTWGNVLKVDLAYGDSIVCNWYNVPNPENGWVTLYKYQCWTATYKSEVDCEIYEFGATFELFAADGDVSQGVGTTNAGGTYTWGDLEAGTYSLDEISHKPCKITSTKVNDSNNIVVDAGQGTVVKVYNCSSDGGKPTPGGKPPTKYPNTGVGTGVQGPVMVAQGDESPDDGTPTDEQEAAANFYQVSCLNEPAEGQDQQSATSPSTEEPAADDNGGLPPFLQPTDDTDAPSDATLETTEGAGDSTEAPEPSGDTTAAEECQRGSVPERLVIDTADVDYEIEVLEIVDGVMQAPTGPNVVSWYKETARLGEPNNIVIAGHVNWWGVPEGPFFNLQNMEEGDRIEITGEDGTTYVFEVQWVREESNLAPPDPAVVGPTGAQTLTLITCGGEWDASISEYNARTVVRAIQVDTIPAEAPAEPENEEEGTLMPLVAWLPWRYEVVAA